LRGDDGAEEHEDDAAGQPTRHGGRGRHRMPSHVPDAGAADRDPPEEERSEHEGHRTPALGRLLRIDLLQRVGRAYEQETDRRDA
jgi:hypothetical protein